jgi:cytochrome P450
MSDDLPLPTGLQLTALDPVFRERPHEYLDRLRSEDPIHRDNVLGRRFVTGFDDARSILSDRSLSNDPRKAPPSSYHRRLAIGDAPIESVAPSMLHLDDPEHKRIRGLVSQAFNQRSVDAFRPRITAIAEELLDKLEGRDSFDVIAEYASPLPIIVIAEMLGVDAKDMAQFKRCSDALSQVFNPARTPEESMELGAAQRDLDNYFMQAADARRRQRGDDLVSALVWAEESGTKLNEHDIAITCNLLLVAGNLTTTDLIGNGVLALLKNPDQLAKFRAEADLAPKAVEEILRYDPPVAQSGRITLQPCVVGGTEIKGGESVSVSLLAAGHDPARHSDPHRFDIERADTSHHAFGGGAHYCLGAPLARAEAQIALRLLFERFPGLCLDSQHAIEHKRAPVFNGLKALWVRSA